MLLSDTKGEISAELFPLEFQHHMRAYCGWSGVYSPDVIEEYHKITGIPCAHIERVASGNARPCDQILNIMKAERVRVEYEYYREIQVHDD